MNRATLLAALRTAAPALGDDNGALPALSHFCFDDDSFYAFNDLVAVVVGLKTGLTFGLHGNTLLGILGATRSEEVDLKLSKDGQSVQIVGGGNVKLPVLSRDQFVFNPPDETPNVTVMLMEDVKQALEVCLVSVADDSLKPEYNGVTMKIGKLGTIFLSTDNNTATRVLPPAAKVPARKEAAMVLPKAAADLILKLFPEKGSPKMLIGERMAIVEFGGDPEVTLVTKLLGTPSSKLAEIFEAHVPDKGWAKIPEGFAAEIEKARVLASRDSLKEVTLSAFEGKLHISASATLGQMKSSLKIEAVEGQVVVNPDLVARILPFVSLFFINPNASLIFGGGAKEACAHVISAVPQASPAAAEPARSPAPTVTRGGAGRPTETVPVDMEDDIPF